MAEKNVLFLVSVNSEYPVQITFAKLLREKSSFHPIFGFDSVRHNLYKEIRDCKNEGFNVVEFTKSFNYRNDKEKSLMTYHQSEDRNKYNRNYWKDISDILFIIKPVSKLFKLYSRVIWSFRQFLIKNKIIILIVSNNKFSFNNPYFIKAAQMEGIQVITLPFGMPTTHTLATLSEKVGILNLNRPINKLTSLFFPKWRYQKNHFNLFPIPAEFIIVMELLDAAPEQPWSGNGGRANFILTESNYMKNHYMKEKINKEKIILTGALYNDVLSRVSKKSKRYYEEFCLKHGLDSNKPMVLTSFPIYLEKFMENALEFPTYEDFVRFYIECMLKININYNIVISIHPRMYPEHITGLYNPRIIIADERLENIMPLCKFYINSGSTTTRWAIACAKPTINYDFYRLKSDIFTEKEGVVTVNTTTEFEETLDQMCNNHKYYINLKQKQEKLRPHYGLLDGNAGERMLNFFESIVIN
ncbi:MAG: hypothetical protein GYB55_15325 [Cytophagales bacterium]|uniref:hypothetical protein n=1 Tax=Cyclobacterium marinum TaxID=104 RepID=UPI0030D9F914|nr:hypothetical protein [Cytophagales bacterium]|tara:strand:+ start:1801 stop:3216 length:1416 start_codon:yes stop_codon:yes gene_type:complete